MEVDLTKTVAFAVEDKSILTVNFSELGKSAQEQIAKVDAANRKPIEDNWRSELDELERRLKNFPTESEAKHLAAQANDKHKENIKGIEREIKYVRSLLDVPGLSRCTPLQQGRTPKSGDTCDVCLFNHKIEKLEWELGQAKEAAAISIRRHGGTIASAKELDRLRPRWKELSARASKIDVARRVARGKEAVNTDLRPMRVTDSDRYVASQGPDERDFDLGAPAK